MEAWVQVVEADALGCLGSGLVIPGDAGRADLLTAAGRGRVDSDPERSRTEPRINPRILLCMPFFEKMACTMKNREVHAAQSAPRQERGLWQTHGARPEEA